MRFPSHALKGAVLLTVLTAPAYADQRQWFINQTRSMSLEQIAQYYLNNLPNKIAKRCNFASNLNQRGISFYNQSIRAVPGTAAKTGVPIDVIRKDTEGKNYAMQAICPNVF